MADNSPQNGTDSIRDKDRAGVKTQIMGLDLTPAGAAETLMNGYMPVRETDSAGQSQYNFPAGFVRVSDEPHQTFYDAFDTTLDVTNNWNTPTVANGGTIAATGSGGMTMGTGVTANGQSRLTSQPSFKLVVPAWLGSSFALSLPDGAAPLANAYRFWGNGTVAASPTPAAPLTDAVGYEVTTAGRLCAVVYAAGVRTQIADLGTVAGGGTGAQVLDALQHRYICYVRTDRTFWYIDSLATPVATSSFQAPAVQSLPLCLLALGGATPPTSDAQIKSSGLAVWDTGKNALLLADGITPWVRATIKKASTAAVATDTALVVAQHPSSPTPAGQNTIGAVSQVDGFKATYSASVGSLAGAATDIFTITGSASKTIRVTRISVSGTQTTAGDLVAAIIKRSTANTGGTSTAPAAVPHDSLDAAATATVLAYTAAPTLGTIVGSPLRQTKLLVASATAAAEDAVFDFGTHPGTKHPVLRGTAQVLAVNMSAAAVGASYAIDIEWTEE